MADGGGGYVDYDSLLIERPIDKSLTCYNRGMMSTSTLNALTK